MARVLVVDDDPSLRKTLGILLRGDGYDVLVARDGEEAEDVLERERVDVVLLDLQLPGADGLTVLRWIRDRHRDVETIIVTAHGSVPSAVAAMKEGAFDYLTKPFTPDELRVRLRRLHDVRRLRAEVRGLRHALGGEDAGHPFATRSPAVRHVLQIAKEVAPSEANLLLTGESGTGKTLLARLIHGWSGRAKGPFVVADCTTFHDTLLESELFGHRKGAFTGAVEDKPGRVEIAEGGTLFLDEIGEIAPPLQGKLLRILEERRYARLGDPEERRLDARIVAATNRDLLRMVREGEFREDLYYRLAVIELEVPPLRSRPADVELLAGRFLVELNELHGRSVERLSEEVRAYFATCAWPGNVRELHHVIERAVLLCPGPEIRMEHLPPRLREEPGGAGEGEIRSLAVVEEQAIRDALSRRLPLEETARRLGIDPSTLWRKRRKYGL